MKTLEVIHGRYRLIAGKMGEKFVARAFLQGPKRSGVVGEAGGPTAEEALDALREALNETDTASRAARRSEGGMEVASEPEFRLALAAVPISDAQNAMLHAHAAAGDEGLTAKQLASVAGYKSHESVNLNYGKLGRSIAEYLNIDLPEASTGKQRKTATLVLAAGLDRGEEKHFLWTMHPELRAALQPAQGAT